jgi:hypothetical protein
MNREVLKSYARSVTVAVMPLLAINEDRWQSYLYAALLAIVGPLIRAADPQDHAFGFKETEQ